MILSKKEKNKIIRNINALPRVNICNLPTDIEFYSNSNSNNIYIKRDDRTLKNFGGNKARKQEYVFGNLINKKNEGILWSSSAISNEIKTIALFSHLFDKKSSFVVWEKNKKQLKYSPNIRLAQLYNAEIIYYKSKNRETFITSNISKKKKYKNFYKQSITDEALGAISYFKCGEEINGYMIDNNFTFDYIFICSSGGSQSGLELAKLYYEWDKTEIIGINHIPWKNEENLKKHFSNIWTEMNKILDTNISMPDINNITKYALPSYGKSNNKTMKLIKDIAINKKILFDPYYSGKAFGGMMEHLKNKKNKKVLFIHTGGGENLLNYSREITPINFKTLLNYLLYKSKRTSLKKLSKIKRFILNE